MKAICILVVAPLLLSCIRKTLYDITESEASVTIDWTPMQAHQQLDSAQVLVEEAVSHLAHGQQPDVFKVALGTHQAYFHSIPKGISVDGYIASIATDKSGFLVPQPGVFFYAKQEFNAEINRMAQVTLAPAPHTRQLDIALLFKKTDTALVQSVTATLNNAASSFNMYTGQLENPASVAFPFNQNDSAHLNLFGVIGSQHIITLTVITTIDTLTFGLDVSDSLINFNNDMSTPMTLNLNINDLPRTELALHVNWGSMTSSDSLSLVMDQTRLSLLGLSQPEKQTIAAGVHQLMVYNMPQGITVENGTATVVTDTNNYIYPSGSFYSSYQSFTAIKHTVNAVNVTPEKVTRHTTFVLRLDSTTRVYAASATLDGIAHSYNMRTRQETNTGNVAFAFTEGSNNRTWIAEVDLFGTVGTTQMLTLRLYAAEEIILTFDISDQLKGFNLDKTSSKTIFITP